MGADLAINPMLSGIGMNVKMLEYRAWGLPMLTTPWGARGVQGQDGQHVWTAAPEQVPAVMRQLASDPAARLRLGMADQSLVEQRYLAAADARDYLALGAGWQADRQGHR